jgi:tRNA(Ile)-lysidine synthase
VGPEDPVLAGLSSGPDSTALVAALAALGPERPGHLAACIVDHGIRPRQEIEGDIACARELCDRLRVPLQVRRVPPGACVEQARREHRSLEEVARRARLAALAVAAREAGCELIALGHTRDDGLETVLMRLLAGAGPRGLAGIRPRRGRFVRPLLAVTRAELVAWLAAAGLRFRTDSSNADPRFLRNRLRRLAPALDEAVPGWRTGLEGLSRWMGLIADHLDEEAAAMAWQATGRGWEIPRGEFFAAHPVVRLHSLLSLADRIGAAGQPRRLPARFLQPALGPDPGRAAAVLVRGHGLCLACGADRVRWEADIVTPGEKGYLTVVLRDGRYPVGDTDIVLEVRSSAEAGPGEIAIASREIDPPVVMRSRRKGDTIRTLSGRAPGTPTLKRLFNEWRIPEEQRWRVPVLADRDGVLAVIGDVVGGETVTRPGPAAVAGPVLTLRCVRGGDIPRAISQRGSDPGRSRERRGKERHR